MRAWVGVDASSNWGEVQPLRYVATFVAAKIGKCLPPSAGLIADKSSVSSLFFAPAQNMHDDSGTEADKL